MSFPTCPNLTDPAQPRTLLRARVVLPITRPPIQNGAVLISGGHITAVDSSHDLRNARRDSTLDLGATILMPGLVNAHCHLDYTDMAGEIPCPKSFSDWIRSILLLKGRWMYSDYAASWLRGARMLLNHGSTTVANVEAVPELLPDVLPDTPLRVCSLLELTGLRSRRAPEEILQAAVDEIQRMDSPGWAGLSPHAPYSTTPPLLRLVGKIARQRRWPVATHVAESAEEFDMFTRRRGRMFAWLKELRDMSDFGKDSPVRYLHRQGLIGENFLAVHANYLAPGDAEILGQAKASVVHCPRSHAYFGHHPFPFEQLTATGVNTCLGTDSLASVECSQPESVDLDLFSEMRTFAERHPKVTPKTIVRLATINGARALRAAGKLGELSPGACADMITVPYSGNQRGAWAAVVRHQGSVSGVMINGRWVLQPPTA